MNDRVSSLPPTLAYSLVEPPGAGDRLNLFFVHGFFGRGRNWSVVARQFVARRPQWRAVLVDLRGHGDSPEMPGPDTVNEVAKDLARLAAATAMPMHAVLGHSFGGKVTLAMTAIEPADIRAAIVVDASPGARQPDGSAWQMLRIVRNHPGPFPSRRPVADAIEQGGFSPGVAAWMTSNLVRRGHRYVWRLDLGRLEDLLHDYFRRDFWHVVEAPPLATTLHVVKATASPVLDESACDRIARASAVHGRVKLHRVEGGHWLNIDNPDALVSLLENVLS